MIALLTGKLISKTPDEIVLDVTGVGYHILITLSTYEQLPEVGEDVTLNIFTYVREDTLSLFGFVSLDEKHLFTKLIKVNGIGPKLGRSILSGVPPHDFVQAVSNEDKAKLNAIPGVGKKTAERIILDLKDKLKPLANTMNISEACGENNNSTYESALSALTNLGYQKNIAEKALSKIGMNAKTELTIAIKDALKELAK